MALDWRDKRTWQIAGTIGTVLWVTHVAIQTGGDPRHPLFDWIFLVPLAGWIVLLLLQRLLGRGDGR